MYRIRSGRRRDWWVWITLSLVVLMHSVTVGEYHSTLTQVSYIPVSSSLNTLSHSSLRISHQFAPSHLSPLLLSSSSLTVSISSCPSPTSSLSPIPSISTTSGISVFVAESSYSLAARKPANQSTTYKTGNTSYPACFAVDGLSDGNASHTDGTADQWWSVDLGKVYPIDTIRIYSGQRRYYLFTHAEQSHISTDSIVSVLELTQADLFIIASADAIPGSIALSHNAFQNSWNQVLKLDSASELEEVHSFNPAVLIRHLAIYRRTSGGIRLKEVQVFGRCKQPTPLVLT